MNTLVVCCFSLQKSASHVLYRFFMDNFYAGLHVAAASTTTHAPKQSKCDNLPNVIHTVIVAVNPPYLADFNVYN